MKRITIDRTIYIDRILLDDSFVLQLFNAIFYGLPGKMDFFTQFLQRNPSLMTQNMDDLFIDLVHFILFIQFCPPYPVLTSGELSTFSWITPRFINIFPFVSSAQVFFQSQDGQPYAVVAGTEKTCPEHKPDVQ